jgi:hypothetical protein
MSERRRGKAKPRGQARVKRQEVQGEDGWTVITHGLSKVSIGKESARKTAKDEPRVAGSLPTKTVEGLTAENLHADFKKLQERWKDTAVARQLDKVIGKGTLDVEKAVCIGIGSFSRDWDHRHRSMWQLVLFLDTIGYIKKDGQDMKMFAQDPAFTPLDISFLQLLGIIVVESGIEEHIIATSFVFSPFVDWYILLPSFLKAKDPELYIGNEILDKYSAYAQTEDKREKLEECNELGKTFLVGRTCLKLRDFEHHAHALNGMVVYTRTNSPPT